MLPLTTVLGNLCNAYLLNVIDCGIHSWTFKIHRLYTNYWGSSLDIGIWKINQEPPKPTIIDDNQFYGSCKDYYKYGYAFDSVRGKILKDNKFTTNYGKECKNGYVIKMILNLIDMELSYCINNINYGFAYKIEKTKYMAAIYVGTFEEFCIELVESNRIC